MKKLDKLIIKSFYETIVAIFFITVFVLIMQFFGYGLMILWAKVDTSTIFKFILYLGHTYPYCITIVRFIVFFNDILKPGQSFLNSATTIKSSGISLLWFMEAIVFCGSYYQY